MYKKPGENAPAQVELQINNANLEAPHHTRTYSHEDENNPNFKSKIDKVNIVSRLNFLYTIPLLIKSWKKSKKGQPLTDKDLITFPYKHRGEVFENEFVKHLKNQKAKNPDKSINTAFAVANAGKWMFLKAVLVQTIFGFLRIFSAWIIKRIIDCYLDVECATTDAFWWAAILAGVMILAFYFEHHWNHLVTCLNAYLRAGVISMLYSKITRLSIYTITKISPGKLVNIAANDVNVFEMFGVYFPSIISGWFILIAGAALLWIYFGVTCLLGIGYLLAIIPIQAVIAFVSVKPRNEKNVVTDERVRKTGEAIEGIRLLKMYTWELKFQEIIDKLRKRDVKLMHQVLYWTDVLSRSIAWTSNYVAAFLIFMLYNVTGGELTIGKVFSGYFILGFIRFYFVYFISNSFNFVAETRLFFNRLDAIMEAPEIGEVNFDAPNDPQNAIEFEKFAAYWAMDHLIGKSHSLEKRWNKKETEADEINKPQHRPTLTDIDLNIKKGSLNAVVGTVGAGKTSFLLSFTGEMPKTTGHLRYQGRIAYVEQEPTIFAGTFRESILFGREYDEEYYLKVIKACNLESDLKLFPEGDMSMIGEKGNNLSGGQKARLALARAVYADADIYLLDDPLSAVDAKVAKSIYNEAIRGLLRDKTVILVTHQVHFVRDVEHIIVMDGGKIIGTGVYEQLSSKGIDVKKIFSVDSNQQKPIQQPILQDGGNTISKDSPTMNNKKEEENTLVEKRREGNVTEDSMENENAEGLSSAPEDRYAGQVNLKTYILLFKEVGFGFMLLLIIVYILVQFGDVAFGRILGAWTSGEFDQGTSLGTIGGITAYMIVIYQVKNTGFTFGFLRAARKYHKKMLKKVLSSPVSFFDTNPVGRILTRFSNDIGVLDKFVPHVGLDVFDVLFAVGSVFITLAIIDPVLLGPICGEILLIFTLVVLFYPAIKQTKGYDLRTRGPLFSLLSSSISGIVIIRTYGQVDHLKEKFTSLLYTNTKGNIGFILCSRILGFCVDLSYNIAAIGMVYITTARINPSEGPSSGAIAAFSLALILSLTGLFQHGVRQFCQTNVLMAATSRVQAYCDLPSEAPVSLPEDIKYQEKSWPQKGDIEFKDVYMKYRPETDFVIKGLNLDVKAGEKIGCVGRTGAGKSTIINLLFRLQEVHKHGEHAQSYIKIDNTDTQPLGLHLLRGNISIIPQTPFIFTGTVKQNVDPLGLCTDEQIWSVLQEVRLKDHVSKLSNKLETNMSNASAVFSVGQKQLVCLARTLLKPCKVLVLDEATANMDTDTDIFIQQKIMEKFKGSTVFTIAHRLATIADYDKVLVLDKGQKVEFDEPYKLLVKNIGDKTLTNTTGHFGSMVANTGAVTAQRILNIAKEVYEKKQQNL